MKAIRFSGEMVRAILDGRKTQTRRVIKLPKNSTITPCGNGEYQILHSTSHPTLGLPGKILKCPYGRPGDRLWVREMWSCIGAEHVKPSDIAPGYTVYYHADPIEKIWRVGKWRPSIHMPRWASRIALRVTDVRVERLQEITEANAKAEGCSGGIVRTQRHLSREYTVLQSFIHRWDSINAKRGFGWNRNPWVWVVNFELTTEAGIIEFGES